MFMALTGNNGDNETNIGMSDSINYSLYDENIKEIPVKNLNDPIEFWIGKDKNVFIQPYQYINAINATQNQNDSLNQTTTLLDGFLVSGFTLSGQNVSISVQIKPENIRKSSIGYLALLKFGDNPIFNSKNTNYYDIMSLFCHQNDLVQGYNESYYFLFANMSRVNSFKVTFHRNFMKSF